MAILRVRQPDGSWAEVPALRGSTGNGIESVTLNDDYTLTIRFTDGTEQTTESIRGEPGKPGTTDFTQLANKPQTETWTFTLEDGSTVTKAVYVG